MAERQRRGHRGSPRDPVFRHIATLTRLSSSVESKHEDTHLLVPEQLAY